MDRREQNRKWYHSFDEKSMTIVVISACDLDDNDEGNEDWTVPAKFEVCGTCDGKGVHVNPSIDSHGLSREDFDEDPDFRENYMSGMYNVQCNECHGARVVPVMDESRMKPEEIKKVNDHIQEHYDYIRMCEAERRMGA